MVLGPDIVGMSGQLPAPATRFMVQVSAPPAIVTVTVPPGVPTPGSKAPTVAVTVTGWVGPFVADGSGLSEVTVVIESALLTTCVALPLDVTKFPLPLYVANTP